MISIAYSFNQFPGRGGVGSDVTALGRPQSYDIPIPQKSCIALCLYTKRLL